MIFSARTSATTLLCSLLGIPALMLGDAPALAQVNFRDETISIQIGYGPGGGYDTYGRVLARHYGRFIPGNPNVVPKNMPGAGSLRAANHIYNLTARDPVDIGLFSASTAVEPMMGNDQAKFDVTKFGWIGSMNQDISFCGVWQAPGLPTSFPRTCPAPVRYAPLITSTTSPLAIRSISDCSQLQPRLSR